MESAYKIRVFIADDHQIVRQGLRTFIDLQDDLIVIGEAGDGQTAVEMISQLQPDVILMDLVMPRLNGISAIQQILALNPSIKVIVLTSFTEDDQVFPAIEAGASSYLLKDVSPDELAEAVRAAYRGEARLHPDIARKLMEKIAHPTVHNALFKELTERELMVIRLVTKGCSNFEIAQELYISEKTVKTHMSNILNKLNVKDRTQLAIFALKNGLVGKE